MGPGPGSLGGPDFNQTWNHGTSGNFNGTFYPSSIFAITKVPSNSYGMHVGSAAMAIQGSLTVDGYDQSRALGNISTQSYAVDHLPIDLLDIGIGVAEGTSPFNFTSERGLLASSNSSIGVSISVNVEATAPYLSLPNSTCEAITRNLPVTYDPDIGLYLWNTEDSSHKRIVSSPAFLSSTFRLNNSISLNLTINVSFALLNLTIDQPIVSTPTQYFPCTPRQGYSESFELGRAFLQAAFMGVNWQTDRHGFWFLAQAPGPNTPSNQDATATGPEVNYIIGSSANWADSWKGSWTTLDSNENSSSGNGTTTADRKPSFGISRGAIAGIVVGVAAVGAVAAAVVFALNRRHRMYRYNKAGTSELSAAVDSNVNETDEGVAFTPKEKYGNSKLALGELDAGEPPTRPIAMEG